MIKLYNGDCLDVMPELSGNSIDITVTSPPYDNLRSYNNSLNWSKSIWEKVILELYRITKNGGVVVWIVGDAVVKGSESGTSFRQALKFMDIGFSLHDTMIFEKHHFANPSSNRYHQTFEYIFVFSKGKPSTFNPIKDKPVKWGKPWGKSTARQKDGSLKARSSRGSSQSYGMRTNVWKYTVSKGFMTRDKFAHEHPAMFPEKLAEDHIISWSKEKDIVFDPFMGSGTAGVAAKNLNRNFIGIEKEEKYFKIAEERINKIEKQQKLF